MNFFERVWGKDSRTGTRQVYDIDHPVVHPEFHCRSELRVTNQHSLMPQDRIPTGTQIFHTPQARDKDSSILASCFPREQIEKHSSKGLIGSLSVLVLRTGAITKWRNTKEKNTHSTTQLLANNSIRDTKKQPNLVTVAFKSRLLSIWNVNSTKNNALVYRLIQGDCGLCPVIIVYSLYTFLGNCPPTPPLS